MHLAEKFATMLDPLSGNADQPLGLHLPYIEKGQHSEIAYLHAPTELEEPIIVVPPRRPLLTAENIALIAIIFMLLTGAGGSWSWSQLNENRTSQARL